MAIKNPRVSEGAKRGWAKRKGDIALYRFRCFWSKVLIGDGCWEWTASKSWNGYGRTQYLDGREGYAHRISYEQLVGVIPPGLQLDHLCRNRACVRPDHLEPVTNLENHARGVAARTHCKHGHEFTKENTWYKSKKGRKNPSRRCRECTLRQNRAYFQRKRLEV